ncbi:hypothetical protein [Stappia indica]|uniref:hypothetical protein n=1 Tax=Stappia indica TaxID=538381 RepID=UPI001CD2F8DE|nr:hypothetical protein [Stappia indica]MCA1298048.1 hypothetical protein [Stappia indica]
MTIAALLSVLRSKAGLVGLLMVGVMVAAWWHGRTQYRAGYQAHETEMAVAAAQAEKERQHDDTRLRNLSDHDLCVEYLGARGMPVVGCDRLRGLQAQ